MCIVNDLLCQRDVVFKAMLGTVDHDGREAAVDAGLADLKILAVVQMQSQGQTCLSNSSLDQLDQIVVLGILSCAGRDLQNDRGLFLCGSFCDALDDLHIVYIEGTDGVAALIGLFKHFFCGYEWHVDSSKPIMISLFYQFETKYSIERIPVIVFCLQIW